MKKINLKGISETLSEKEMKNVMGGSNDLNDPYRYCFQCSYQGIDYDVNVECDPPSWNCRNNIIDSFGVRCQAGGAFWRCNEDGSDWV